MLAPAKVANQPPNCEARPTVKTLFAINASLLIAHEIDSAYWREWELFGLPGGVGAFIALHVGLILVVLLAFEKVVLGTRRARLFAAALAATGLLTVAIHSVLLAAGKPQFATAGSIALLGAIGLVSVAQVVEIAPWRAGSRRSVRSCLPSRPY